MRHYQKKNPTTKVVLRSSCHVMSALKWYTSTMDNVIYELILFPPFYKYFFMKISRKLKTYFIVITSPFLSSPHSQYEYLNTSLPTSCSSLWYAEKGYLSHNTTTTNATTLIICMIIRGCKNSLQIMIIMIIINTTMLPPSYHHLSLKNSILISSSALLLLYFKKSVLKRKVFKSKCV